MRDERNGGEIINETFQENFPAVSFQIEEATLVLIVVSE